MQNFFFVRRCLKSLSEGSLLCYLFYYCIRAVSIFAAVATIVSCIHFASLLLHVREFSIMLRVLFTAVFTIILVFIGIQVMWIRSEQMRRLANDPLPLIPLAVISVRLLGELYACLTLATVFIEGIGYPRIALIPRRLLFSIPFGNGMVSTLVSIASEVLIALFCLLLCYLIAAVIEAFFAKAEHTKRIHEWMQEQSENQHKPE